VSDEQAKALDEMKLSPSKLLQKKIDELTEQYNLGYDMNKERIDELFKNIESFKKIMYKQRDYMEKRGILEDFIKEDTQ